MKWDLSVESWNRWMALPRQEQVQALDLWLSALPEAPVNEAWNRAFGPDSLFDAWTRTQVAGGVYAANWRTLAPRLSKKQGWRVVEIGGGDGRLWRAADQLSTSGQLAVVDPAAQVHDVVSRALPASIAYRGLAVGVQDCLDDGELWHDLDAVVCSLTLHHLAGADAAERASVGLDGPGKLEVLQRVREGLAPDGILLLNEADVYCDVGLAPGDDVLVHELMDSYIRRCAGSILRQVRDDPDATADLRARWAAIVRHWCLEQVRYARVPIADRDVYELDVPRWLALIERAGFVVVNRQFTDQARLFCQYTLKAAPG